MKTDRNLLSRKNILLFFFLLIIIPVILNFFIDKPNPFANENSQLNETHWLTFLGGYLGASLSILATLFVLRVTLKNHNDLKQLQIKTIKFNARKQGLDDLKKRMTNEIRSINLQTFVEIQHLFQAEEYNSALLKLSRIISNVEFQYIISNFYRLDKSVENDKYTILSDLMIEDYGTMITDMQFLTKAIIELPIDVNTTYDSLIKYSNKAKAEIIASMTLLNCNASHIAKSTEIFDKITVIDRNNVFSEIGSIFDWVFGKYRDVYTSKQTLVNAMGDLIKAENKRINDLLLPTV